MLVRVAPAAVTFLKLIIAIVGREPNINSTSFPLLKRTPNLWRRMKSRIDDTTLGQVEL
jgi:hypothetical protein